MSMPLPFRPSSRLLQAVTYLCGSSLALAVPLAFWRWSAGYDWHYFDSLSWVVRSAVLHYRTLPLHDPWVCGGVDLAANPQSRLLSPLMLLDLALTPHNANLLTLWLFAAGGWASMTLLLRHLGRSRPLSLLGGWLFIASTWFSLHWSEGHIRFAAIALLPLVCLTLLRLSERRMQLALATLLSFFMLEGAIYAFVYSLYLALALTLAGMVPWRQALAAAWRAPLFSLALLVAAAALIASKAYPIEAMHDTSARKVESVALFWELPRILFWPRQSRHHGIGLEYRFHEYGMYLGVVAAACVAWGLRQRELRRSMLGWLLVAVLFFWAATNWLTPLSPWSLLQNLPLLRNAHVPSRLFVLFHIAWIVVLTASLERLRPARAAFLAVAVFLAAETLTVSTLTWLAAYSWGSPTIRADATAPLITVEDWHHTIEMAEKPAHYGKGLGSRYCYEPVQSQRAIRFKEQPVYVGELELRSGRGKATLETVTPGRVTLHYEGASPAIAEVNLNALGGWVVESGAATVLQGRKRLAVQFRRSGPVTVRYRPFYLPAMVASWSLGTLLLLALWLRELTAPRPGRPL
ncbi:MAG TPA: hypothetical protein VEC57_11905 [Candidatus Limnocylindrales bacterium]|nr:hypothetical protein [Candidatus Limnocylindrales bacterium]